MIHLMDKNILGVAESPFTIKKKYVMTPISYV